MLYRDRAKKFPNSPKTLEEYDSSLGMIKLLYGDIYNLKFFFKNCGIFGGQEAMVP